MLAMIIKQSYQQTETVAESDDSASANPVRAELTDGLDA